MKARSYSKPVMTIDQSVLSLRMLLVGCSDHALAAMTPEYLASSYRVKPARASLMLTEQRAHRAARGNV